MAVVGSGLILVAAQAAGTENGTRGSLCEWYIPQSKDLSQPVPTVTRVPGKLTDLARCPASTSIASHYYVWSQADGSIYHKRAGTSQVAQIASFNEPLRSVTWLDPSRILAGGDSRLFLCHETESSFNKTQSVFEYQEITVSEAGVIHDLATTGNGRKVAAATDNGVFLWRDFRESTTPVQVLAEKATSVAFGLHPDQNDQQFVLICGQADGVVTYRDLTSMKELNRITAPSNPDPVRRIAICPTGIGEAFAGIDSTRHAPWLVGGPFGTTSTQIPARYIGNHRGHVTSIVFTQFGRHILSGDKDGRIKWWEFKKPLAPEPQF